MDTSCGTEWPGVDRFAFYPLFQISRSQGLANFEVEAWFGVIGLKSMGPATVKQAGIEPL